MIDLDLFKLRKCLGDPAEICPKCWGEGIVQQTAAVGGIYFRCWLCRGTGEIDPSSESGMEER